MTQEPFVPDIEQVKKVSLQFQEVFKRMDREIGVLDGIIADWRVRSSLSDILIKCLKALH